MAEITCAMWNCSGILPTSSAKEKIDFLKSCLNPNIDILILIETHHKLLGEISPLLHAHLRNSLVIHTEASKGDPYAGIVVLISERLTLLNHTTLLPGRLLNFKIKCLQKCYNITAFYGYTSKNVSQEKMKFMTEQLTTTQQF